VILITTKRKSVGMPPEGKAHKIPNSKKGMKITSY
jgi:hypothetical protein